MLPADLKNLIVILVKRILLSGHTHPRKHQRTASGYNIHFSLVLLDLLDRLARDSAVQRHKIHAILGMQAYHINKILCGQCRKIPLIVNYRIIYRHGSDHSRTFRRQFSPERNGVPVRGEIHDRMRSHVNCRHHFFHLHVIILTVSGDSEIYIDLRPQHRADTLRVNAFVMPVRADDHLSLRNERHQLLCGHALLRRNLL